MSPITTICPARSTTCSWTPTGNTPAPISARRDDTLEQAQAQKKAHIAAKLRLQPGLRVLDIGCGWGGMALTLARDHGAQVTGVTLSEEQHRVATRRAAEAGLADRIDIRLMDYRAVEGTVRPDRFGGHVRTCRRAPLSRVFRQGR